MIKSYSIVFSSIFTNLFSWIYYYKFDKNILLPTYAHNVKELILIV